MFVISQMSSLFYLFFNFYLFIWLRLVLVVAFGSLVAAFGIQFPDPGSNTGHLHWELGVLATGPPEVLLFLFNSHEFFI